MVYTSRNGDWPPFDWDDANVDHVERHGVDPVEAEEAVFDPGRINTAAFPGANERRRAYIGATGAGRILVVVVTRRSGLLRVITARDAKPDEKRRYHRRRGM